MSGLLILLTLLSLLSLVGSLVALVNQKWRPKAKWIALGSFIAVIVFPILLEQLAGYSAHEEARQKGFLNSADFRSAKEVGVTDASEWYLRQAKNKAEREELLKPPAAEVRFVTAVENGRALFKAGQNDLQRGAARPARAQAICAAMPSSQLDGWIGAIYKLSTNGDGDGVLTIKLPHEVFLGTWNNSLSDIGSGTLIKSNSSLYRKLLGMKIGDVVRIYGQMFAEGPDCYREMSLTLEGSLREPNFLVRFSEINTVN
jgi:hypothetical protein